MTATRAEHVMAVVRDVLRGEIAYLARAGQPLGVAETVEACVVCAEHETGASRWEVLLAWRDEIYSEIGLLGDPLPDPDDERWRLAIGRLRELHRLGAEIRETGR